METNITLTDRQVILELQRALEQCMTGGNHLASNLIGALGEQLPSSGTRHGEVRKILSERFPDQDEWIHIYEEWCCWDAIMRARHRVTSVLRMYQGEVLVVFQE